MPEIQYSCTGELIGEQSLPDRIPDPRSSPERGKRMAEITREKVLEILQGVNADIDYENEKALIDDEILNSFDVVAIISDLGDEFDIDISVDEMIPENFNSLDAVVAMVARLAEEQA